jgi:hypothetical protein
MDEKVITEKVAAAMAVAQRSVEAALAEHSAKEMQAVAAGLAKEARQAQAGINQTFRSCSDERQRQLAALDVTAQAKAAEAVRKVQATVQVVAEQAGKAAAESRIAELLAGAQLPSTSGMRTRALLTADSSGSSRLLQEGQPPAAAAATTTSASSSLDTTFTQLGKELMEAMGSPR